MELAHLPITEDDYFSLISCIFDYLSDYGKTPSQRYVEVIEYGRFLKKEDANAHLIRSLVMMVENLCALYHISHPLNQINQTITDFLEIFDVWYEKYTLMEGKHIMVN